MLPLEKVREKLSPADRAMTIEDVSASLMDEEVAYALAYLANYVEAKTLGDLLSSERALHVFGQALRRDTQQRVLHALDEWALSETRVRWRWPIQPSPMVPAPPESLSALRKWVKKHDIEAFLGAFGQKVRPFAPSGYFIDTNELVTVEDILWRRGPVSTLSRAVADRYAIAARSFLHYRARRHALVVKRRELWQSRPHSRALRLFASRMREAFDLLDPSSDDPVFLSGDEHLVLNDAPPSISVRMRGAPSTTVRIEFMGFETAPVRLTTARAMPIERAPEVRALVEWTRDIVHDIQHPLHETLERVLSKPTWMFVVDALAKGLEESEDKPSREQRLLWRIEETSSDRKFRVDAIVQKRLKSGKWSKGARTAVNKIPVEALGPADHLIYDEASKAEDRFPVNYDSVLLALVGHPRVEHEGRRISIHQSQPTLALTPADGGVHVELRLLNTVFDPDDMDERVHTAWDDDRLHLTVLDQRTLGVMRTLAGFGGVLPPESYDRILELLARLQPNIQLQLPTALRGDAKAGPSPLVVRLDPDDRALALSLRFRPFGANGGSWPAGSGPRIVYGTKKGKRMHVQRDLLDEQKQVRALQDALGLDQLDTRITDLPRALGILDQLEQRAARKELITEWPRGRKWKLLGTATSSALKVQVQRAGDWFGVEGYAELDGVKVPLSSLLKAVRRNEEWVQVAPGRFAKIADGLRDRLGSADDVLVEHKGEIVTGVAAVSEVKALVDEGNLEADDGWLDVLDRMERASELDPELPDELDAELREYQTEGFVWLARLAEWGAGACLADEMGLGKTVQALAMLLRRSELGPALVVAPTSVGATWRSEAKRFAPELNIRNYRGPKRASQLTKLGKRDVVVTSYDILARDGEVLANQDFATFILDEAQAIKNARTKRAKAARGIQAQWRLALTGTPLENHLGELWSLFRVVSPGLLGTWPHFRERFASPIERDGIEERQQALAQKLHPFLLRRTKSAVAQELPPRTEVLRPVEFSEHELAIYNAARQEALDGLVASKLEKKRFEVLAALTRLRLLACHPRLVDPTSTLKSSKVSSLLELIDDLRREGHRTLVFSQFVSLLDIVREELDAKGIDPLYLVGSTPAEQRERLVDQWQEGEDPVFLISLKAGGTGLTLTGADTVIHLDPWWNPAVEDQASDRAHRIGQEKPVTVVRLVTQGTIEESVLRLHDEKRALVDGVLEGSGAAGSLSAEELVALIRGESD